MEATVRDFNGRVAVVTGAASGIGRALAARFAREKMKVVLADVEAAPLEDTREALLRAGAEVLAVRCDVSRAEEVDALARRALEAFGAVHVLCNNAGVALSGLCWEFSVADWQWVLGVNLWGVIHGVRSFVPAMIAQGVGHVVNTASIAGLMTTPGMAPYGASKHAVVAISECLHHDLAASAANVQVSVLCPAWVKTSIGDAERNRPGSLPRRAEDEHSSHEQVLDSVMRASVANGIPPEVVADKVLQAITEERFWILTHSRTKALVERRVRGIVDDELPVFET